MATDLKPVPKVAATGAGGIAATILIVLVKRVFKVDLAPEVAAAVVLLIATGSGYLRRDRP